MSGEVQFVLWKAGEQGHAVDFWYPFGSGHAVGFKPEDGAGAGMGEG